MKKRLLSLVLAAGTAVTMTGAAPLAQAETPTEILHYYKYSGILELGAADNNDEIAVVSYNADGSMRGLELFASSELAASPKVDVAGADYVKVLTWDSLENMKPKQTALDTRELQNEVTISANTNPDDGNPENDVVKAGYTLNVSFYDPDALYYEYQWLRSSDGEIYTDIITDTSADYYISNQDKGRYISVEVTPVYAGDVKGETIRSADAVYIENLGNAKVESPSREVRLATRTTPEENRFSIEGSTRPYVLLDEYEDTDSAFYILADYLTTPVEQHNVSPRKIDPNDPDSIGYFLNTTFATQGYEIAGTNKEALEPSIYEYVDKDHQWWVEAGIEGIDSGDTEDYYYTAGVGIMTQTESMKYLGKYGWNVASEHGSWVVNWHTSTGSEATAQYVMVDNFTPSDWSGDIANAGEHNIYDMTPGAHKEFYARPSFYLAEDFFRNVRLNVGAVGDNVKKMLRERYTPEELFGIYSEEELRELGMYDTEDPDPEEPTEGLKILAIGNSFSVDSMEYLYDIASELTDENIVLGNLYVGGCTLNMHNTYAKTNATVYDYYKNTDGTWDMTSGYTMQRGILDEDWDIITLQQASGSSGMPDTYNSDLDELVSYVWSKATNPDMQLGWNMTWAYAKDSDHVEFPNYGSDQMTMYNAIVNAVETKILTNDNFDFVIPTGTAIQNARTSYIGDNLTRDGYHLSYTLGRYIAALTWARQVTGAESVEGVTWVPSAAAVDSYQLRIAKESVENAFAAPYEVTESVYKEEPNVVRITSDIDDVKAGARLTASYNDPEAASYKYQWLISDNGEGFDEVYSGTTDTYVVTNQDKNKYINCRITPVMEDGTEKEPVTAEEAILISNLGLISPESRSAQERFDTMDTPEENLFSIEGGTRKYVLLDKFNDNASMFYVLANYLTQNVYGLGLDLDVSDVEDSNALGYWLNNDYVNSGYNLAGLDWPKLEEQIYQYVDKNHTWWLEAGIEDDSDKTAEDHSYVAGISMLTESEARKYWGVYGWHVATENGSWYNPWLLATGDKAEGKYIRYNSQPTITSVDDIGAAGEKAVIDKTSGGEAYARPSFYLGRDFFKNVRLDLDTLGDNVKKMIRDTYEPEELTIYTAGELRSLGYTIMDASIEADTGDVIEAKTTLTASMGDENAVSYEYQWLKASEEAGVYEEVKTAVTDSYYVTNQDKGEYIKCTITPIYEGGSKGTPTTTDAVYVENLGMVTLEDVSAADRVATADTPEEYLFAVDGSQRQYALLDEFNDPDSTYFVLANYMTSTIEFDSSDPDKLDPNRESSVAYWLNNDFALVGYEHGGMNWPKLEEGIYNHIDKNHTWWVEAGIEDGSDETAYEDYSYTAGIGLLTESESVKYKDRFGWHVPTENGSWYSAWYLATGNYATDKYALILNFIQGADEEFNETWVEKSGAGRHVAEATTPGAHTAGREQRARPAFYLDENFFTSVKLDLSRTGDAVKDILKQYSMEQLSGLYNYSELAELGFDVPISIVKNDSGEYKNGEIFINLDYTATELCTLEVRYVCGNVNGTYSAGMLWEGDRVNEQIPVDELPTGENTITVSLVSNDNIIGEFTETIYVVE